MKERKRNLINNYLHNIIGLCHNAIHPLRQDIRALHERTISFHTNISEMNMKLEKKNTKKVWRMDGGINIKFFCHVVFGGKQLQLIAN